MDLPHGTPSLKNTLLLATHTEEPALRQSHELLATVTHTSNKLKDQHTNQRHQKEPFLTLTRLLLLL